MSSTGISQPRLLVPSTSSQATTDEAAWQSDHPYQKPTASEANEAQWTGHCHCGAIEYHLLREKPLNSKYCHCGDCQRMHGAPFQWAAIFHKFDLRFTHGSAGLAFYSSEFRKPVHQLPCKVYCATCHSPIMDEGRNMIMLFPELLSGIRQDKGKEAFKVREHICWPGRLVDEGVFAGDGVRKWRGVDGSSECLCEGGHGA